MPVIEWNGKVRITVGEMTRASQLDLFVAWQAYQATPDNPDTPNWLANTQFFMETDALVAVFATRKIEVCDGGKWKSLDNTPQTVVTEDGDTFTLSLPPTAEQINACPRSLGDKWIEAATAKNGGINANLTFFTSWTLTSGKTNSEPASDATPSTAPTAANS